MARPMAAGRSAIRALLASALLFVLPAATAACPAGPVDARARVDTVYDGDTVRLSDGREVRLVGLNTPELDHGDGPDQPLAVQARRALRDLLATGDARVALAFGPERHDHYDRLLAHVFLADGRNLTRLLLERGLGWQVAIPPNLGHLECYTRAEGRARSAGRGVWGHPAHAAQPAAALDQGGGFRRVRGRIEHVGTGERAYWLDLRGLTLRLARSDLPYFDRADPRTWRGRRLVVRGWIYRVDGEARMNLRHPAAVEWLKTDT